MKRLVLLLSVVSLMGSTAMAADLGWNSGASPMYSPTPAASWSGFYAGVSGGYGFGTFNREPVGGGAQVNTSAGGFNVGLTAGYNADMGGFVIGGETDLQYSAIGYSQPIAGGSTFKATTDFFGTVRARGGMTFGAVMPFVTGGFAYGRGTASVTDASNVVTSQSNTHYGWTLGAGLEAKATDNISIKAEYMYVNLGTRPYNLGTAGNLDVTQNFSVIRAGVNYKF